MALTFFKNKKHIRSNYKLDNMSDDSLKDIDEIDEISTILDITSSRIGNIRPDLLSSNFQTQQFSIATDPQQWFKIELGKKEGSREYFSISKVSIVYLGLYPKDKGILVLRVRDTAYRDKEKQIEFEGFGSTGNMWGMVGSMSHSIYCSNIDNLFIEVIINNTSLMNVIIGEAYILWEFTYTDIPIQTIPEEVISFQFKPIETIGSHMDTLIIYISYIYIYIGEVNTSWFSFKEAIVDSFKRTIPSNVAMQKVEARKWNSSKESFHEYAMEKLAMMQGLRLAFTS